MRLRLAIATGLALGFAASPGPQAQAQSPNNYRYCQLDNNGGTDCYYNSRAQCGSRCIENPGYVGPASGSENYGRRRR